MASYRQRVNANIESEALKEYSRLWNEAQDEKQMAMSAEECYRAGAERGSEDRTDGYMSAIERRSLGDDYGYPEEYRRGYRDAFYKDI